MNAQCIGCLLDSAICLDGDIGVPPQLSRVRQSRITLGFASGPKALIAGIAPERASAQADLSLLTARQSS